MLGLGDVIRKGSSLRAPEPEGVSSYSCKDVGADGQEGHGMARVRHLRLFLFKILSIHPHLSPSSHVPPSLSLFVGSFSISFSEGMQIFGP